MLAGLALQIFLTFLQTPSRVCWMSLVARFQALVMAKPILSSKSARQGKQS